MKKVKVKFQPDGYAYTYETDADLRVGDEVLVPTDNPYAGDTTGFATVVQLGSDYEGPVKRVLGKMTKEEASDES